jgi:hypothetical protein
MNTIEDILKTYESIQKICDTRSARRCTGGYRHFIRTMKTAVMEYIVKESVKLAWQNLGGTEERLDINSSKIHIPIQRSYVEQIKDGQVRKYIFENINQYYYGLSVDKHVFIDGKFVMGIECKAYTENAMIKRILIDFHLLKTVHPHISCFLFQLESQLGGDYSKLPKTVYGSVSTHSIMSYFEDVDLHIFTLLEGERKISNPIHKFFKPLEYENVEKGVKLLESYLKKFV